MIQKIYEAAPLTCAKCSGKMKIISVSTFQLPMSDKWLYAHGHVFSVIDPEYPEAFPP